MCKIDVATWFLILASDTTMEEEGFDKCSKCNIIQVFNMLFNIQKTWIERKLI